MWEANFLQKKNNKHTVESVLFKETPVAFQLPALSQQPLDDAIDEIELIGFPICNVFELADDDLNKYLSANEIEKHLGKEVNVLGYLSTTKPVRTIKNDTMYFHTFIDAKVIGLILSFSLKSPCVILLQEKDFIVLQEKWWKSLACLQLK
ncbi:MAG: polymerase alpha subunit [Segetibacter sp.]|nr:polymerase alpha subunit [Segetibacter sp.]